MLSGRLSLIIIHEQTDLIFAECHCKITSTYCSMSFVGAQCTYIARCSLNTYEGLSQCWCIFIKGVLSSTCWKKDGPKPSQLLNSLRPWCLSMAKFVCTWYMICWFFSCKGMFLVQFLMIHCFVLVLGAQC